MAQPAIVLQLGNATVSQGPIGTSTPQDAAISELPSESNGALNSASESIEPHPIMAQPATVQGLQQLTNPTSGSPPQDAARSESPSEADRAIAEIFDEIDTWRGKSWSTKIADNYSRYNTFLRPDVSREFCSVMLDKSKRLEVLPWDVECGIAVILDNTKASDLYYRFQFLLDYLDADQDNKTKPIQTFIEAIEQNVKARRHWPISTGEEFKCVWHTLSHALDFPAELKGQANSFQGPFNEIFNLPLSRNISASFSISLADLESLDIRVKPTTNHFQHLVIEGDAVNILEMNYHIFERLDIIKNNRAAKVLGIASLGDEILASLHALYVKDMFFDKAEALRIFSFMGDSQIYRGLVIGFLHQASSTQPQVLADRTRALQRFVDDRRSWWRSLVRDLKRQFNAQPLFFYGALLAVFFGICTVIQTVASVWSLVLALKAT